MPVTLMSATNEVALASNIKSALGSSVKVLGWNWNDPVPASSGIGCNTTAFGADPDPGKVKAC